MDSVKKAREKLWGLYPKVLVTCGPEALAYGQCVTREMAEVKKGHCEAEFQRFKACLQSSAKKLGGKGL